MWLTNRTEFSFRAVYGPVDLVAGKNREVGSVAGVCDNDNTFSHVTWKKACAEYNIKPVYGVRLAVTPDLDNRIRRYPFNYMAFIALDNDGLTEIYQLVKTAHDQFYYRPRISYDQLNRVTSHVVVLSGLAPDLKRIKREWLLELSPALPYQLQQIHSVPAIACSDNWFIEPTDRMIYEPLTDRRKRESKTTPQWILTEKEWLKEFPGRETALKNLVDLGNACTADLNKAEMVQFPAKQDIDTICRGKAPGLGINLKKGKYAARYKREMKLIQEKGYTDYFLIVADLIKDAKKKMIVGPGRGSSSGSLVCFLLGITTVDPLKYGLIFERFIDVNRADLPDIDIDFQDDKRKLVVSYLQRKYGPGNVAQIANISRLKPRSAIATIARNLKVPANDTEELKDSIIQRAPGNPRANFCIMDTYKTTDIGQEFLKRYPRMEVAAHVENHADHSSVHAAGVIVNNEPISKFCGLNTRDGKTIAMIDKRDAEALNLLKIDVLGLRTLAIIHDTCKQINKPLSWIYSIPLDDKKAYKVFNKGRYTGIFQFDGTGVQALAKRIKIQGINDISAIVSIARPGPMISGAAEQYVDDPGDHHIIYQEQVMALCREYAGMEWEDISALRKAFSKSMGEKYFSQYKTKFMKGAVKNGHHEKEALKKWEKIRGSGSYLFNKSHAVAYSIISYWCAYLKAHYPLAFSVATLNNSISDRQAVKILRDLRKTEGIYHVPFDPEISTEKWSYKDGKLYGGLLTINGIGPSNAKKYIKCRNDGTPVPPGIKARIRELDTPFLHLYPGKNVFGQIYKKPWKYGVESDVSLIKDLKESGQYHIIGCLIKKAAHDVNELDAVSKRGGKFLDGPTTTLKMVIEDDSKELRCIVGRHHFEGIGKEILENGSIEKTWYLLKGNYNDKWGIFYVEEGAQISTK